MNKKLQTIFFAGYNTMVTTEDHSKYKKKKNGKAVVPLQDCHGNPVMVIRQSEAGAISQQTLTIGMMQAEIPTDELCFLASGCSPHSLSMSSMLFHFIVFYFNLLNDH